MWNVIISDSVESVNIVATDDLAPVGANSSVDTLLIDIHYMYIYIYKEAGIQRIKTLRSEQNGCHFADDIIKLIFLNENFCILTISLKLVLKGAIKKVQ